MTDTNKERAEFEARYASQPDATAEPERSYELDEAGMNELIKDCIWEGWKARAAKAPAAPGFQQALDIRTAQGWKLGGDKVPVLYTDSINGQQVCRDDLWLCATAAFAVPPAAEPVVYCDPDDPLNSSAFVWPGIHRDPRHTMPLYTAPPAPTEQQIGALQAELAGNEAATMHLSRMVDELRALLCQAMRVMKDLHESATPDESREDCPPIIPTSDFAKFVNDNAALMYAIKQCGHDAAPPQGAAKGTAA